MIHGWRRAAVGFREPPRLLRASGRLLAVLAACHRWSLLSRFDRVLFVEDGAAHELAPSQHPRERPLFAVPDERPPMACERM